MSQRQSERLSTANQRLSTAAATPAAAPAVAETDLLSPRADSILGGSGRTAARRKSSLGNGAAADRSGGFGFASADGGGGATLYGEARLNRRCSRESLVRGSTCESLLASTPTGSARRSTADGSQRRLSVSKLMAEAASQRTSSSSKLSARFSRREMSGRL